MKRNGFILGTVLSIVFLIVFIFFFWQTVDYYIYSNFSTKAGDAIGIEKLMKDITQAYGIGCGISCLVFLVMFLYSLKGIQKRSLKVLLIIGTVFLSISFVQGVLMFLYPIDFYVMDVVGTFPIYYLAVLILMIICLIIQIRFEKNQKIDSDGLIDTGFQS